MPTVRSATVSGLISARRFGIKSANKINVVVTIKKAIHSEAAQPTLPWYIHTKSFVNED